jgi:hypothetical protein
MAQEGTKEHEFLIKAERAVSDVYYEVYRKSLLAEDEERVCFAIEDLHLTP